MDASRSDSADADGRLASSRLAQEAGRDPHTQVVADADAPPAEYTREPSTTGLGPWVEHDFTGRVLSGRFELRKRLGKGGMATVYEAFDQLLHKSVAVKILNPEHQGDEAFDRRFLEEARAISQLEHSHIVDVIDIVSADDGLVFLIMELLKGEDLGELLWNNDGPLPWARVVKMATQICEALIVAHDRGVIHRDIKPANCMRVEGRGQDDFIVVLDFGIAKFTPSYFVHKAQLGAPADDGKDLPTDRFLGTPGYGAPEQFVSAATDPRVDIYGLGALMYRLLTDQMPIPSGARSSAEIPAGWRPKAPHELVAHEIPVEVDELVLRALDPDPENRFASARELLAALQEIERTLIDPGETSSVTLPLTPAPPRAAALWRTIGLVITALLAGFLIARGPLFGPDEPERTAAAREPAPAPAPARDRLDAETPATDGELVGPALPTEDPELPSPLLGEPAPELAPRVDETTSAPAVDPEAATDDTGEADATDTGDTDGDDEPDAGPQLPRTVPVARFKRVVGKLTPEVRACYKKHTQGFGTDKSIEVGLIIAASTGRVEGVTVPAKFGLSSMKGCIAKAARSRAIRFGKARQDTIRSHIFKL
ncbi:MAG: serine/threonine protein kinase [Myxococcales bacterium]|nr:serine/threonine protein kinase [Myxococcales bacterium]